MADTEPQMPMDEMENAVEAPPASETTVDNTPSPQRDEQGRFAPKAGEEPQPRGRPDPEAAARRERAERDEARREAAEAKENYAKLQKRLDDMAAFAKGEDPNAEAAPADPLKPLLEKVEAIDQRLTQSDQNRQQEEAWTQVRSFADQDEQRFRSATPDFPNAVQHYIQSRVAEITALGYSEEQAGEALAAEAQQLLVNCAQSNRSPAETLYTMAKARGYQAGQQVQHDNVVPMQQRPAGGRSLGNSGAPAGGGMTAAQIAALSEEDYFALRKTPEGARMIKRAMGG